MATSFSTLEGEMKLSDAVKKHPILYDKNIPGFHLKEEKNATWSGVAEECGLKDGTHAYTSFTNLRTKYGRKKGALKTAHMSGADMEEVHKVSVDYEKYRFMEWIRPYMNERSKRKATNIYIVKEEYSNTDDGEDYSDDKSVTEYHSPVDITVEHLSNLNNSTNAQKYPSYIQDATTDRLLDAISNQESTTTSTTTLLSSNDNTAAKRLKIRQPDSHIKPGCSQQKTLTEVLSSDSQLIHMRRNNQTRPIEDSTDNPLVMFGRYVASELQILGADAQDMLISDINTSILKAKKFDRMKHGEV